MQLPEEFVSYTRKLMGDERFGKYLKSFDEEVPVSIRLNPLKMDVDNWKVEGGEPVPWCRNGYYLARRPNFTFDPLMHAGVYYVQEASSMFLDTVLRQHVVSDDSSTHSPLTMLDLCAAPGGKSTLARTVLPEGSTLYANEPIPQRASILAENLQKWGWPDCIVTNNYPRDYLRSKLKFDIILCDVPCSGEGMFRKDEATIREWSMQNVERCWRLQREIVSDAWACLSDNGLLVYSTCTLNTKENEENVRWICEEFDAELLPVETRPEWNITGSLLPGFTQPVYRFIPGFTRGEGLFMAVLRKNGSSRPKAGHQESNVSSKGRKTVSSLKILAPLLPSAIAQGGEAVAQVDLDYQTAIAYLRHEALSLPEGTPCGLVEVCFQGHPLGYAKNIGTRANNLYPKEWKIKTTHVPVEYETTLFSCMFHRKALSLHSQNY